MPVLDNPKHELFAQELAKGSTASAAYVAAGYKPSDPHASRLASNGKVSARVAELQSRGAELAECTVASIIQELEEARTLAKSVEAPGPMVTASMGKAKVSGLLVDRTEHTGKDGGPIVTENKSELELARRVGLLLVKGEMALAKLSKPED